MSFSASDPDLATLSGVKLTRRSLITGGLALGTTFALAACAPAKLSALITKGAGNGAITGNVPARPTSFLRTSWSTDPFAEGSYSFLAPSEVGTDARTLLAAPEGPLRFAGEGTSSAAPATTHGALESGRRAAAELADIPGTVLVIGAGFAGLAAARALVDAGRDVIVLEARSRVPPHHLQWRVNGLPSGACFKLVGHDGPLSPIVRRADGPLQRMEDQLRTSVHNRFDPAERCSRRRASDFEPYSSNTRPTFSSSRTVYPPRMNLSAFLASGVAGGRRGMRKCLPKKRA